MLPQLENVFGIHETALKYRGARADVLAANIANAETPGYRARDIRFEDVLGRLEAGTPAPGVTEMRHTLPGHLDGTRRGAFADIARYRLPLQGSLDQNSVDTHSEYSRFADNAMRYQASLRFLNGRISGLISALKGE